MAARDAGLIIDSLGNNASMHTSGNNVTVSASISPSSGSTRMMLTNIPWSVKNMTAAAATVSLNVRDSSIGGTLRASWDIVVATNSSLQDSFMVNIKGLRGQAINVDFGLPASSVNCKVTAVGWEERSSV